MGVPLGPELIMNRRGEEEEAKQAARQAGRPSSTAPSTSQQSWKLFAGDEIWLGIYSIARAEAESVLG